MKFTEITLQNYKPFYGPVTVQPTVDSNRPILLVQGKNDSGKTSLHSAFLYCLYGVDDRQKLNHLINRQAAIEDNGVASVTIAFEHGDEIYEIERGVEFSKVDDADERKADSSYRVVRTIDGDIVVGRSANTRDYKQFINRVLPENVANFFFFDAEELNRFEESYDKEIREAIETVLGIQEIENAVSDLRQKRKDFDKKYTDIQATNKQNEERKGELSDINERINEIEGEDEEDPGELDKIDEELSTKRNSLSDVSRRLEDIDETAEKRKRVEELDEKIKGAEAELKEEYSNRHKIRREAGPIIGMNAAEVILSDFDADAVSGEAKVITNILNNRSTCICGEELTESHRKQLMDRWTRLNSKETRQLSSLQEICERADVNVEAKSKQYQNAQKTIQTLEGQIDDWIAQKEELEQEIEQVELETQEKLAKKKQKLEKGVDDLEEEKDDLNKELGGLESKRKKLLRRIKSQGSASEEEERFEMLMDLAERCRKAMVDIKDDLVEQRRSDVEEHASETFRNLTNRPDHYKGLKITENYDLRVLTENSTRSIAEQDPSEGQKQIIAYAFIAGLSRYTTRNAPVVIDTPIGRLDHEHKSNLLDYYHNFSDQVMILYQPNEMAEEDIGRLESWMSKHFQIRVRDDVEDASTIEELSDLVIDPVAGDN
jgi:DNA sulfur modification protein DndD